MKKISNVLLSISILLITLMLFVVEYNKNDNVFKDTTKTFKTNSALAIMLDNGNGNYTQSTSNTFPTSGYTFNTELSKCENGGEVTWDDTNKKVIVSSNISDKCYIYFDKIVVKLSNYIKSLYTTQGANNLYHHDGTLANGINDGSYRYAGSYETTNNWVCFGTDAETCDDEHLYRVIGVFGDQIKLIKAYEGTAYSLGSSEYSNTNPENDYYKGKLTELPLYYWNNNGTNNWETSYLNLTVFNGNFLIKLEEKWAQKISNNDYKIGGNTWDYIGNQPISSVFQYEIINPNNNTTLNSKVGLMYLSDYGFAASPSSWTLTLESYGDNTVRNNNWLHLGVNEWTITKNSNTNNYIYIISENGASGAYSPALSQGVVRPTFYLNSNVAFAGGTGTETNPYRIA